MSIKKIVGKKIDSELLWDTTSFSLGLELIPLGLVGIPVEGLPFLEFDAPSRSRVCTERQGNPGVVIIIKGDFPKVGEKFI